jgi:hypothetical protein
MWSRAAATSLRTATGVLPRPFERQGESRGLGLVLDAIRRDRRHERRAIVEHPVARRPIAMHRPGQDIGQPVRAAGRCSIACRNYAQAATDAADRASIQHPVWPGSHCRAWRVVAPTRPCRYLEAIRSDQFAIDPDKVDEEANLG